MNTSEQESVAFKHEDFVFDTSFHETMREEGGIGVFKLKNSEGEEIFLVLFNDHNGYYGHGFEMKIGDETKYSGCL